MNIVKVHNWWQQKLTLQKMNSKKDALAQTREMIIIKYEFVNFF